MIQICPAIWRIRNKVPNRVEVRHVHSIPVGLRAVIPIFLHIESKEEHVVALDLLEGHQSIGAIRELLRILLTHFVSEVSNQSIIGG